MSNAENDYNSRNRLRMDRFTEMVSAGAYGSIDRAAIPLQKLLDSVAEGIYGLDTTGRCTFANESCAALLGFDAPEELIGRNMHALIHHHRADNSDYPVEDCAIFRVLRTGTPVHAEDEVLWRKDGSRFAAEFWSSPIRENDVIAGAVVTFVDITTRKQSEAALRESELRKSAMLDVALDCLITMDHHGRIVDFNPAASETFGYSRDEAVGKTVAELLIPERLRQQHKDGLHRFLTTGERRVLNHRMELPALRADGREIPVEIAISAVELPDRPPFFIAYLRDISERKKSESDLRESEARFRTMFDSAGVSVWEQDFSEVKQFIDDLRSQGVTDFRTYFAENPHTAEVALRKVRIVDVNDATLQMLGATSKRELLSSLATIFVPETMPVFVEELVAITEGRARVEAEAPLRTLDGRAIDVIVSVCFPSDAQDYSRIVVSLTDISSLKEAEERLRRSRDAFFHLVEDAPFGVYVVDSQFKIYHVNAGSQYVFQNVQPLIGRDFGEALRIIWPADFAEEAIAHFRHTLETGEPYLAPSLTETRSDIQAVQSYEWQIRRIVLPDGQFGVVCYFYESTELRKVERALRESELRYRQVVHAVPVAVYTTDAEGRIVLFNDAAVELWGRTPVVGQDKWCGSTRMYTVDETPVPHDQCPMAVALRTGRRTAAPEELIVERADGARRYVLPYPEPLHDDSGNLVGAVNMVVDVTERYRATEALEESAQFLRRTLDALITYVGVCTIEGILVEINKLATDVCGVTADDVLRRPFHETVWWKHDASVQELVQDCLRRAGRGEVARVQTTYWSLGDNIRLTDFLAMPMRSDDGTITHIVVSGIDVTDRVRAEEAVRERKERLRAVIETAVDGIITIDEDGIIETINHAGEQMFEYGAEEVIGHNIRVLIPNARWTKQNSTRAERARLARKTIGNLDTEVDGCRKDGSEFPVGYAVSETQLEDGRLIYTAIVRDISTRKALEEERSALLASERDARGVAESSLRAKDEFLALVTHELRSPLATMLGWLKLMRRGSLAPEETGDIVDTIVRSGEQLEQLIDDLMEFSRAHSGKLKLDIETLDIVELAQQIFSDFEPLAEAKSLRLTAHFTKKQPQIRGDLARIRQIFNNLLSNALKFTPAGGEVTLRVETLKKNIRITVADTGIGISADVLPHLFEPFRQADTSITRKYKGLGLGLSLVKQLTELHGGLVRARSDGEGRGATITVELPRVLDSSPSNDNAESDLDVDLAGVRALIVDDEPAALAFLARILTDAGADVTPCNSAEEVLIAIGADEFDLLISDISMPDCDGYSLLRKVRDLANPAKANIPAIAVTAFGRIDDQHRSFQAGFDAHHVKPLSPTKLCAAARDLVNEQK